MDRQTLSGKVAIITGATKGIGLAIAQRFAQEKINLVLNARTQSDLEALAADLEKQYSIKTAIVAGSVGQAAIAKKLVDDAVEVFGRIDILINNAGIAGKIALLHEVPIEEIDETIDTNLKGPIYLMKYALPVMVHQHSGTIINLNSVAGKTAFPYWSVYDASKFGLRAITEAVAEEQRTNHIRVIGIYPGAVDTPLWEGIEINHEPNRAGMLKSETIADTILFALQQPEEILMREIELVPLIPAL
jgi:NADP-dependent 3-hydroxy acid dehydrogenase YdfG